MSACAHKEGVGGGPFRRCREASQSREYESIVAQSMAQQADTTNRRNKEKGDSKRSFGKGQGYEKI